MTTKVQFTDEDMAFISRFKAQIDCCLDSNYIRGMRPADLDALREVWERVTGKPYHLNGSCSSCVMAFIGLIGKQYRAQLAEAKEEPKKTTKKSRK